MAWPELLPSVLRAHHDRVNETGLSPYQIVFGRERNLVGLPWECPEKHEDAEAFLTRMEDMDAKVSGMLSKLDEKEEASTNMTGRKSGHSVLARRCSF